MHTGCKLLIALLAILILIVFIQLGTVHRRLDQIDHHLPNLLTVDDYFETFDSLLEDKTRR